MEADVGRLLQLEKGDDRNKGNQKLIGVQLQAGRRGCGLVVLIATTMRRGRAADDTSQSSEGAERNLAEEVVE